jgi:hypothetical protein
VTLLLLMVAFGAVTIIIISATFRASDVYKHAVSRAMGNLQVREQIGEPIKAGWFIFGELKYAGNSGHANFSVPISGPRAQGRIRVIAYKDAVWRFTCLQVVVEGQPQPIDLLSIQPTPERDF